jgi:hypothetical protein
MDLVMGLCSGYKYSILKPLIHSLKKTGFKGDIVLFVSNLSAATLASLKEDGVSLINYIDKYPYFSPESELANYISPELKDKFLSPNSLRYIFYQAFLKANVDKYNWVLHTDTRDVVFQKDPFKYYGEPGLYCFLEDLNCKIKDNKYNAYWIKFGFGDLVFEQMANEPISCSGVTLGSRKAFMAYLEKMINYIIQLPNTGGLDQGIHNYLIYTKQIERLNVIQDDEGPVTTLTTFKPYYKIKFNKEGLLLNNKNEILHIVHQYDRHLSLLWKFNKPAFFEKTKNLTKRRILMALGKKVDG